MSALFHRLNVLRRRNLKQCLHSIISINQQHASSSKTNHELPQWSKLMYNADGSIKDYYSVFGVQSSTTYDEIKKAYYDLNKLLHPDSRICDVNINIDAKTALAKLGEAQEAYYVLRSRRRRAEYDSECKRIAMLLTPDVEELVHDITGWVSKTDKSKHTLHEKARQVQFANYNRYKKENTDPNTFIQMAHKQTMFNRVLANEQEIASKESMDVKLRRQRTLNYKLWKEKMDKKKCAFGATVSSQTLNDPYLNEKIEQLSDINHGNRAFYQKLQDMQGRNMPLESEREQDVEYMDMNNLKSNVGPTPNAYYNNINPRSPFGGDEKLQSMGRSHKNESNAAEKYAGSDPDNYDENIAYTYTVRQERKIKIQRTVNIQAGIGEKHYEIKGEQSSNPDAYKYEHDRMRQRVYEDWKQKERDNEFKRNKGEPLQIEGKIDEHANGYTWCENVGSDYNNPYRNGIDQNQQKRLYEMRGVGQIKASKSYDAFNFNIDANTNASNSYYNGFANYKEANNFDASAMVNSMIFGHIGIISAVLFVFISWRGVKIQ